VVEHDESKTCADDQWSIFRAYCSDNGTRCPITSVRPLSSYPDSRFFPRSLAASIVVSFPGTQISFRFYRKKRIRSLFSDILRVFTTPAVECKTFRTYCSTYEPQKNIVHHAFSFYAFCIFVLRFVDH
jgi:hypothetical protein